MKTITVALRNFFASTKTLVMADLWTITLANGTILRWCAGPAPVTFGGFTWPLGPAIERSKTTSKIGVQVDSMKKTVYPLWADTIGGVPLAEFIVNGGFDYASVTVQRAYAANWGLPVNVVGVLTMFVGKIADFTGDRTKFEINVKSALELLDTSIPRAIFQPSCNRSLYDSGCTVVKATYTVTGHVIGGGQTSFTVSNAMTLNQYALGVITFTSGANNGIARSVKMNTAGGQITLVIPLPQPVVPGDTFSLYPGCSKLYSDPTSTGGNCTSYANTAHFRGYLYVPSPEYSAP